MAVDVVIPELGESVTEAILVAWLKSDGDSVETDEPVAVLETDKADVELPAPDAGVLKTLKAEGETIKVGDAIGRIEAGGGKKKEEAGKTPAAGKAKAEGDEGRKKEDVRAGDDGKAKAEAKASEKGKEERGAASGGNAADAEALSPAVRRLVTEHHLVPEKIKGTGKDGRLTKEDVLAYLDAQEKQPRADRGAEAPAPRVEPAPRPAGADGEGVRREPMSKIRQRIAQRLVSVQQNAAMLTTFNEADMTGIFDLRARYKERFQEVHGVSLGLMSFFVRACALALKEFPEVNASIDGADILYHDFVHMGIAVSTDRGLVVPVLRHVDEMSFARIESEIKRVAASAREGKLGLDELSGGTFTITNGGIFGSMLSTPILNAPQTGILGMHAIQKRPVAIDDTVAIRPMMYLALTYDHRLVDGQCSVKFLVRVKQLLEDPARMMLGI